MLNRNKLKQCQSRRKRDQRFRRNSFYDTSKWSQDDTSLDEERDTQVASSSQIRHRLPQGLFSLKAIPHKMIANKASMSDKGCHITPDRLTQLPGIFRNVKKSKIVSRSPLSLFKDWKAGTAGKSSCVAKQSANETKKVIVERVDSPMDFSNLSGMHHSRPLDGENYRFLNMSSVKGQSSSQNSTSSSDPALTTKDDLKDSKLIQSKKLDRRGVTKKENKCLKQGKLCKYKCHEVGVNSHKNKWKRLFDIGSEDTENEMPNYEKSKFWGDEGQGFSDYQAEESKKKICSSSTDELFSIDNGRGGERMTLRATGKFPDMTNGALRKAVCKAVRTVESILEQQPIFPDCNLAREISNQLINMNKAQCQPTHGLLSHKKGFPQYTSYNENQMDNHNGTVREDPLQADNFDRYEGFSFLKNRSSQKGGVTSTCVKQLVNTLKSQKLGVTNATTEGASWPLPVNMCHAFDMNTMAPDSMAYDLPLHTGLDQKTTSSHIMHPNIQPTKCQELFPLTSTSLLTLHNEPSNINLSQHDGFRCTIDGQNATDLGTNLVYPSTRVDLKHSPVNPLLLSKILDSTANAPFPDNCCMHEHHQQLAQMTSIGLMQNEVIMNDPDVCVNLPYLTSDSIASTMVPTFNSFIQSFTSPEFISATEKKQCLVPDEPEEVKCFSPYDTSNILSSDSSSEGWVFSRMKMY